MSRIGRPYRAAAVRDTGVLEVPSPMPPWIREALVHGAILSAFMGVLIGASLWQNPKIWTNSSPPAIRAQVGPIDSRTRRQKSMWGAVMVVGLLLIFGRLAVRVASLHGGEPPFLTTAAAACIGFQVFNLFDAAVIDIGLAVFQPRWAMVPGVDTTSLRDPRWHLKSFFVGAVMGFPFGLLVAGLDALARAIMGR